VKRSRGVGLLLHKKRPAAFYSSQPLTTFKLSNQENLGITSEWENQNPSSVHVRGSLTVPHFSAEGANLLFKLFCNRRHWKSTSLRLTTKVINSIHGLAIQYSSFSGGNLLGARPGCKRWRSSDFRISFISPEFGRAGWTKAVQVDFLLQMRKSADHLP